MEEIRVHLHLHLEPEASDRVTDRLDSILHAVATLAAHTKESLMAVSAQIQTFSDRVNTATNEIAATLKTLRDKVAAGQTLSAEDTAVLDAAATRLEAMGVDPENPVPTVG